MCDTNHSAATACADDWDVPRTSIFTDYKEMLTHADIDAVEILVPHHQHHPIALAAADAGKHIAIQKPLALNLQEADEIIAAAEHSKVILKVYENFVFYPPIVAAAAAIANGDIGDPLSIRLKTNRGDPTSGWRVPPAAHAWRYDKALTGGGPMTFDDGHHKIAVAQHLMGPIVGVYAQINHTEIGSGRFLDASAAVTFEFDNNRLGIWDITSSPDLKIVTDCYAQDDAVEVTGSAGVLWVTCGHGRTLNRSPLIVYRDGHATHYSGVASGWHTSFDAAVSNTIDAFIGRDAPALTGRKAREILKVASAIGVSATNGQRVALNTVG